MANDARAILRRSGNASRVLGPCNSTAAAATGHAAWIRTRGRDACLRHIHCEAHCEWKELHANIHDQTGSKVISTRRLIIPLSLSAALLLGALFHWASLRDLVSGTTPPGVQLVLPSAYVLLSPLSRTLDAIGLLSTGEHIVLGVTAIVLGLIVFGFRARAALPLLALAILYVCAAALPRPMAKIVVTDPTVVVVDFHSHTNFSGDARMGFSPEENRAWHREAGFNVAYISDHRSFGGAEAGLHGNPARAGDNTVLLSAYEGRYLGTFEIFLGLTRADSAILLTRQRWLREGSLQSGRIPVSVVAMPGPLGDVQVDGRGNPPHFVAIELSDGSPKGFSQIDRDWLKIIRRADTLRLSLVSGSNNHGWARVSPAWTLLRIPGWRGMSPDSLGAAIETTLRSPGAVEIIERRRPALGSPVAMSLTAPVLVGQMLASLTLRERVVWLLWTWGATLIVAMLARPEAPRTVP